MQTDAEPFLQRIRAYPDDDVPRLIFADWLDEQARWLQPAQRDAATARAEFIRVQIALAQPPESADASGPDPRTPTPPANRATAESDRLRQLQVAERELLDAHRAEWAAPFDGLATGPEFRRGFVEEVKIDARRYLRHAHELFAAGPIRHIHLLDIGGSLQAVFQSPYLGRLRALTVWAQHAGERLARAVARCPHLSELRVLNLGRNRLGDDAAELLAAAAVLGGLEELDLSENDVGESGARALAASAHLGRLRRLELRHNQVGPGGAEALAGSDRLASLARLGLAGNDVGVARLHSLARASDLLRVAVLDLSANGLTAAGVKAILARPPAAVGLRELDLSHNDLGDGGARVLAECPHLGDLQVLRLTNCQIGDDGTQALGLSLHLGKLVALDLGNNPINDAGFRPFLDRQNLRQLRRLGNPAIGLSQRMRRALEMRFPRDPTR
jgi:uncharacterized protein (TIGR02996 family)